MHHRADKDEIGFRFCPSTWNTNHCKRVSARPVEGCGDPARSTFYREIIRHKTNTVVWQSLFSLGALSLFWGSGPYFLKEQALNFSGQALFSEGAGLVFFREQAIYFFQGAGLLFSGSGPYFWELSNPFFIREQALFCKGAGLIFWGSSPYFLKHVSLQTCLSKAGRSLWRSCKMNLSQDMPHFLRQSAGLIFILPPPLNFYIHWRSSIRVWWWWWWWWWCGVRDSHRSLCCACRYRTWS